MSGVEVVDGVSRMKDIRDKRIKFKSRLMWFFLRAVNTVVYCSSNKKAVSRTNEFEKAVLENRTFHCFEASVQERCSIFFLISVFRKPLHAMDN